MFYTLKSVRDKWNSIDWNEREQKVFARSTGYPDFALYGHYIKKNGEDGVDVHQLWKLGG